MIPPCFYACTFWERDREREREREREIEREPVIWRHHWSHPFFLFHGSIWRDPLCEGHSVYFYFTAFISKHLFQPSIITSGQRLIQGNLKGTVFISGKPLQPCCFRCACLFYRSSCGNVSWKSSMLNALAGIPLFQGEGVDLTILQ